MLNILINYQSSYIFASKLNFHFSSGLFKTVPSYQVAQNYFHENMNIYVKFIALVLKSAVGLIHSVESSVNSVFFVVLIMVVYEKI